jgi:hypothetical protein
MLNLLREYNTNGHAMASPYLRELKAPHLRLLHKIQGA